MQALLRHESYGIIFYVAIITIGLHWRRLVGLSQDLAIYKAVLLIT